MEGGYGDRPGKKKIPGLWSVPNVKNVCGVCGLVIILDCPLSLL
ncbi:MAG: hypothetical protein QG657_3614 [Acidobacteriota bacterium]|nr:hypothetical protein [Acidobacteriota bacterium]